MADAHGEDALSRWVVDLVGLHGDASASVSVRRTPSGAVLGVGHRIVVKVHARGTDPEPLRVRLEAAASPQPTPTLVAPLDPAPLPAPHGRWASLWPRVPVLHPASRPAPTTWAAAAAGLATLHRLRAPGPLPPHGARSRLVRAVDRAGRLDHPAARVARSAGEHVLAALPLHDAAPGGGAGAAPHGLVHGDWHLGQVVPTPDGALLLDVDDLGVGDPVWDLGRPAGFWAAGLLEDASWGAFLDAYRGAGGPALPATGDPWERLDLVARAAVVVATVRELRAPAPTDALAALCEACTRMSG